MQGVFTSFARKKMDWSLIFVGRADDGILKDKRASMPAKGASLYRK